MCSFRQGRERIGKQKQQGKPTKNLKEKKEGAQICMSAYNVVKLGGLPFAYSKDCPWMILFFLLGSVKEQPCLIYIEVAVTKTAKVYYLDWSSL